MRQINIRPTDLPPALFAPLFPAFHNAGATTGDHLRSLLHQSLGYIFCYFIIGIARLHTGRTEDGNTRANLCHLLKAFNELAHHLEDYPRVRTFDLCPFLSLNAWRMRWLFLPVLAEPHRRRSF